MNNHTHPQDMYYDTPSSRPNGIHRQPPQPLHRQPSRQFDGYGNMPNSLFPSDEHPLRYDGRGTSATVANGNYNYDFSAVQTWDPSAFSGSNPFPSNMPATGRMRPPPRGRAALPNNWVSQHASHSINPFGGIGPSPLGGHQIRPENFANDNDEELIPTAIVIKNIPFAVKKEQLVELMTQMSLPLPYAFNYHFDNGVFRGLAFANFTSAEETAAVIEHLNHFDLAGRKLRVEYKKMLPLHERERIEREKRERRGQLEEQHRPMANNQLHNPPSVSSLSSHVPAQSPSPMSSRNEKPVIDLNDPRTLGFYSQLLLFRDDHSREAIIFPPTLAPSDRRAVHTLAHHMGLSHVSRGLGDQRQVHVTRVVPGSNLSPPMPHASAVHAGDHSRRSLNRAATIDFNEARSTEHGMYGTLRGQQSAGFLGVPDSPSGFGAQQNLRAARSFADLRSYTPSPVPSSASFPATLQSNAARFQQEFAQGIGASNTPTLTTMASNSTLSQHRDENLLVNGLGGMNLGGNLGSDMPNGGSPRRQRTIGLFPWDQDHQSQPQPPQQPQSAGGPIGSNRSFSINYDDQSRDRNHNNPLRQPRGPAVERGPGFSRGRQNGHQGRGSDELRTPSNVEIIVE